MRQCRPCNDHVGGSEAISNPVNEQENRMRAALSGLSTLLLLAALPVLAHHNYRLAFDDSLIVTVEGVVTEFEWVNLHVIIYLDAVDEDGRVTSWVMPTATPGVAGRNGMTADSVTAGDKVIVTGWPSRDGSHQARARTITLEDGRSFPLYPVGGLGMGMGG